MVGVVLGCGAVGGLVSYAVVRFTRAMGWT